MYSYPEDLESQRFQYRRIFRVNTVVYDLGSIICVLLSMANDNNYILHNLMVREYGRSLIYFPSLKCLSKAFLFSSGSQEETRYLPFLDRKCITLTSSEDYGMISQDLCNLVLGISEEECNSTVALLKI